MQTAVLDFETYYDDVFSLGRIPIDLYVNDPRFKIYGVSIKIDDEPAKWYAGQDTVKALKKIDWNNTICVAHNAYFDCYILNKWYKIKPAKIHDTMLIAKAVLGSVGVALDDLAQWAGLKKAKELYNYKGKRNLTKTELGRMGRDCSNHVDITRIIYDKLVNNFPESELDIIDLTIRMYTEPALIINKELLEQNLDAVQDEKVQAIEAVKWVQNIYPPSTIQTYPPQPVDTFGHISSILMSNDKLADVLACTINALTYEEWAKRKYKHTGNKYDLYDSYGVPTKISLNTGNLTLALSKRDENFLALGEDDPLLQALIDARLAVKSTLEETRTQSLLDRAHLPLSVLLWYYGAHTGRYSGGGSINLQNLPRGSIIRRALEAPDGYVVVAVDASQIEARLNMWLAWKVFGGDDGAYAALQEFQKGDAGDIYSQFASTAYGFPVNKKDHPQERFVGKQCILGLGYQMSAAKLQWQLKAFANLDMPIDECERLVGIYRDTYYQIPLQWYRLGDALQIIYDGYKLEYGPLSISGQGIVLPNGLNLRYTGLNRNGDGWSYIQRKGRQNKRVHIYGGKVTENIIQALARIVTFDAMLKISRRYKVVLQVHDEVVFLAPEDEAQMATDWAVEVLSTPPLWCNDAPLAAEGGYDKGYSK